MPAVPAASASAVVPGRIGPNAVIRLIEALDGVEGRPVTSRIFQSAGVSPFLSDPPGAMVDERCVGTLYSQMLGTMGESRMRTIAWIAGQRTGEYLLRNRIPRPVQRLLKLLPRTLASTILMHAIARHAWTFAGSGSFSFAPGRPVRFKILNCPVCRQCTSQAAICDYYSATFERIWSELIHADTRVTEIECSATGAPACLFEIALP